MFKCLIRKNGKNYSNSYSIISSKRCSRSTQNPFSIFFIRRGIYLRFQWVFGEIMNNFITFHSNHIIMSLKGNHRIIFKTGTCRFLNYNILSFISKCFETKSISEL